MNNDQVVTATFTTTTPHVTRTDAGMIVAYVGGDNVLRLSPTQALGLATALLENATSAVLYAVTDSHALLGIGDLSAAARINKTKGNLARVMGK